MEKNNYPPILPKHFSVNEKYSILLFIKHSSNAETYRVKGQDGKLYFLKLFYLAKMVHSAFDSENNLLEIELLKTLKQENIAAYKDSGELHYEGRKFPFLVLDFIAGETLAAHISREKITTWYEVKNMATGILRGLEYLHSLPNPIIHNEITPQNIMLDMAGETAVAKLIDFGYARGFHQSTKSFNKQGLDLQYVASECFHNLFSPQSDLFSVGAVMYHLLCGMPPWFKEVSKYMAEKGETAEIILAERQKPLAFPNVAHQILDFEETIFFILKKALHQDPEKRFQSAQEFIQALEGEVQSLQNEGNKSEKGTKTFEKSAISPVKKGKGFAAIAGMNALKEQLKYDVIEVLENPEEYKKHNIGLPNGMLLYGPPGCGKTFFAERFAEEAGYNFIKVISSDLASIYIHGSQEKIGNLFKQAREQAPTILYFDELDAMIPNRDNVHNQSQSGEVNEFLSQLDNIGEAGVFVIGSTNKPESLDKAVLRAGRLEKWYYIPPPDFDARKSMFQLYLQDRPVDLGLDYEKLATFTENYVSSDLKLIVDEASRKTIRDRAKRISMETLLYIIEHQQATVSLSELQKYEVIRKTIEKDKSSNKPKIGF